MVGKISAVPRKSGKEEGVMKLLENSPDKKQFEFMEDDYGNRCFHVPATLGYEDLSPIAFQGHADMVCVSAEGVEHDFDKDGIKIIVTGDGEWVKGDGTTLGGDDVQSMASMFPLACDPDVPHPPLELIVTVEEEIGLKGAKMLDPVALGIKSRRLINLDHCEEVGAVCYQDAGFCSFSGKMDVEREVVEDFDFGKFYEIEFSGFPGGHSGLDLKEDSDSPIVHLKNFLVNCDDSMRIVSMNGGQAMNAIPGACSAVVFIPDESKEELMARIEDQNSLFGNKHGEKTVVQMKELNFEDVTIGMLSESAHKKLLAVLDELPHGVIEMSDEVDGLVANSFNLGLLRVDADGINIGAAIRGALDSHLNETEKKVRDVFDRYGLTIDESEKLVLKGHRTAREAELNSVAIEAFKNVTGRTGRLSGIHAGGEGGEVIEQIKKKLKLAVDLDMTSIGATIEGAHSCEERMNIKSLDVLYKWMKEIVRLLVEKEKHLIVAA